MLLQLLTKRFPQGRGITPEMMLPVTNFGPFPVIERPRPVPPAPAAVRHSLTANSHVSSQQPVMTSVAPVDAVSAAGSALVHATEGGIIAGDGVATDGLASLNPAAPAPPNVCVSFVLDRYDLLSYGVCLRLS